MLLEEPNIRPSHRSQPSHKPYCGLPNLMRMAPDWWAEILSSGKKRKGRQSGCSWETCLLSERKGRGKQPGCIYNIYSGEACILKEKKGREKQQVVVGKPAFSQTKKGENSQVVLGKPASSKVRKC